MEKVNRFMIKFMIKVMISLILILNAHSAFAKNLIMGANFYNPPYLYIDDNGNYAGFEVDLINAIGKLKGFTVEFRPHIYPEIFDDLKAKKIDFIGNVYNSEKRKAEYLLSRPHYHDRIQFLTLSNRHISDPFNNQFTVATLAFSPIEEEFENQIMPDYPELKMQPELTTYLGFKDLFIGRADVLMTTQTGINILFKNYQQYQYTIFALPEKYPADVLISFLTTKDNPKLIDDINDGLNVLIKNGTYQRLIKAYNM